MTFVAIRATITSASQAVHSPTQSTRRSMRVRTPEGCAPAACAGSAATDTAVIDGFAVPRPAVVLGFARHVRRVPFLRDGVFRDAFLQHLVGRREYGLDHAA